MKGTIGPPPAGAACGVPTCPDATMLCVSSVLEAHGLPERPSGAVGRGGQVQAGQSPHRAADEHREEDRHGGRRGERDFGHLSPWKSGRRRPLDTTPKNALVSV